MTPYEELRVLERYRQFNIKQRMRLLAAIGAALRVDLGWKPCAEGDADQKKINENARKEASKILTYARCIFVTGRTPDEEIERDVFERWCNDIESSIRAAEVFEPKQIDIEKRMTAIVRALPIYEFVEQTRGLGDVSFAQLLAHVGDPTLQRSESALCKRMGIACIKGKAQGRPGEKASKEDWIEHGYNPSRRSIMFVIGDNLIRAGNQRYRACYDRRKTIEQSRADVKTKGHAHLRAHRKIEAMLLRDLFRFANRIARTQAIAA